MDERLDTLQKHHSKFYHDRTDRHFKMFRDFIGDVFVNQVTRAQVVTFCNQLAADLRSRKKDLWTANACIRELKALFNYAIDTYELNIRNPVKGIRLFPVNREPKYIPTDQEVAAVRSLLKGEPRLLFDFVEETGCRILEAVNLKWEDVGDFVTLYTRKAKNQNLTGRRIPVPECLKHVSKGKGKVFTGYHAYPRFLELATGGRWNWHALRHRRASIMAASGVPLTDIQLWLGHSNALTTSIYLQSLGYRR
jgi:integrase